MKFADYAQDYVPQIQRAIPLVGNRHDAFMQEKAAQLLQLAQRLPGGPEQASVLDVGCGVGLMERALAGKFRRSVGVDIESEVLDEARHALPDSEFVLYDGHKLPFADNEFDLVFAVCVFHHVPLEQRTALAAEMARVTSPNGLVVIIEHNPLNPATRLIVSRCEFDRDAVLLGSRESTALLRGAGLEQPELKHILYFPWRTRLWKAVESMVSALPFGAQYCVSATKPGRTTVPI